MSLEDLCVSVSLLHVFSACSHSFVSCFFFGNGAWPCPSSSPPEWLWLPGTSRQPHEPGALDRPTSLSASDTRPWGPPFTFSCHRAIPSNNSRWSKAALWGSVPPWVSKRWGLGSRKDCGLGRSSVCGGRPRHFDLFCRNCWKCWCSHSAQAPPSGPGDGLSHVAPGPAPLLCSAAAWERSGGSGTFANVLYGILEGGLWMFSDSLNLSERLDQEIFVLHFLIVVLNFNSSKLIFSFSLHLFCVDS